MTSTILFSTEIFIQSTSQSSSSKYQQTNPFIFQLSTTSHGCNLEAKIVSKNDPFFLYFWSITSEEYLQLKEAQNLLLTFAEFPAKLAELLQKYQQNCNSKEQNTFANCNESAGSRYSVRIQAESPVAAEKGVFRLAIVEENSFRSFEVVSLVFKPASELLLREHILCVFGDLQCQNKSLSEQLVRSNERIKALENLVENSNDKNNTNLKALNDEVATLKNHLTSANAKLDQMQSQLTKTGQERDFLQVERNAFLKGKTEAEERERENGCLLESMNCKINQLNQTVERQCKEIDFGKSTREKLAIEVEKYKEEAELAVEDGRKAKEMQSKLMSRMESLENSVKEMNLLQENLEKTKRQLERISSEKEMMQKEISSQGKCKAILFYF